MKQTLTMQLETGHDDRRFLGFAVSAQPIECSRGTCLTAKLGNDTCRYHPSAGEVRSICGKEGAGCRGKCLGVTAAGLVCLSSEEARLAMEAEGVSKDS